MARTGPVRHFSLGLAVHAFASAAQLAYPFNAVGYMAILTASVLVLHEEANGWTVLGSAMVVGGLIVVVILGPTHG